MLEISSHFTQNLSLILVTNLYLLTVLTVSRLINNKLIKSLILVLLSTLATTFYMIIIK